MMLIEFWPDIIALVIALALLGVAAVWESNQ